MSPENIPEPPEAEQTPKSSWWPQRRRGKGDVIAARVGEGAEGVAVGKNIVQIGTVVVPLVPLIGILAALVAVVSLLAWNLLIRPSQLEPMAGLFNIAVANFGQLDEAGRYEE